MISPETLWVEGRTAAERSAAVSRLESGDGAHAARVRPPAAAKGCVAVRSLTTPRCT